MTREQDVTKRPDSQPPEQQNQKPGLQAAMEQQPRSHNPAHVGSGKLRGKVAVITGGDSGIGRAVAIAFAKEGADIAILYLNEHGDAAETERLVVAEGARCLIIAGDIGDESFCSVAIKAVHDEFGRIDILINNAGEQHPQEKFENISAEQLERTFRTNIFSMFYLTKAVLPSLDTGGTIVNTASVTAYKGHPELVDYSSTKGAIVAFTRYIANTLAERGIRVNAVAPGPIWTPLIPSTFPKDKVEQFGKDTPLGRAGQPEEVAMAFLFLASADSSYITGQTIHVNGGSIINS
jgi:NAD(P)-dependent dehydrogenase (short-subunit alcohol dehydrogenase family)